MSTLLTKPVRDINSDDVRSFCDPQTGFPENQTLEYKGGGALPSSTVLAKAVSAMANTFGGTLLLGVDEDHESGRPKAISGIGASRELEKQIYGMLLDNITPPIVPLPEIQMVPLPDDSERVVVVMRVAQSDATPHAVRSGSGNQYIYVRIGSESRPTGQEEWEAPASLERLEWLFSRRRKSEDLRNRILDEALDRTKIYYERGLCPGFADDGPQGQGLFSLVPLYPQGPVASVQGLYEKCFGGARGDKDHGLVAWSKWDSNGFPAYKLMEPRTTQNGVVGFWSSPEFGVRSYEFNIWGMLCYQETFSARVSNVTSLDLARLCCQLGCYLELASRFYQEIAAVGLLQFRGTISNLNGLSMMPPDPEGFHMYYDPKALVAYQRTVDYRRVLQAGSLSDDSSRDDLLLELLTDVGNAFNWDRGLVRRVFDAR